MSLVFLCLCPAFTFLQLIRQKGGKEECVWCHCAAEPSLSTRSIKVVVCTGTQSCISSDIHSAVMACGVESRKVQQVYIDEESRTATIYLLDWNTVKHVVECGLCIAADQPLVFESVDKSPVRVVQINACPPSISDADISQSLRDVGVVLCVRQGYFQSADGRYVDNGLRRVEMCRVRMEIYWLVVEEEELRLIWLC